MAYKGHKINPNKFEVGQIKIFLLVLPLVILTGLLKNEKCTLKDLE